MGSTVLIVITLLLALILWINRSKNVEGFKSLCSSLNHRSTYPYDDDQNRFYAELTNSKFSKVLGKKTFKIPKDVENPLPLKTLLENWLNSFKDLKKKKSTITVVDLENEDDVYKFYIYRPGRSHAKAVKASITQSDQEVIIKNFEIIGVIDEYELLHGGMSYSSEQPQYLKFNKLEDIWQGTTEEKLIKNA